MCGIYARLSYFGGPCTLGKILAELEKLRHRGNDGIGVAIESEDKVLCIKRTAIEDFPSEMKDCGDMGVGHVRYRTKGNVDEESCQPLVHNNIVLVHNGHIKDTEYNPDSLVLLSYFQDYYPKLSIFQIVKKIMRDIPNGSYSCIVMIAGYGLVAFRDRRGIRPLVYHQNEDRVIIASESIVVNPMAIDVGPGACVVFPKDGGEVWECCAEPDYSPCIFEYIYFAHKNSTINGIHVYKARQILGQLLAKRVNRDDYDMIVPVPKTSCVSAKELSRILDLPYEELLTVRRGRSFILPKQTIRVSLIQEKFRLDEEKCKGKRVLLVDDSIVRGTTMRSLVKRFWDAGVVGLDIASCAPPVISPNVYGIDISSPDELIVNQAGGPEGVAALLDADKVIYQDLDEMCTALAELNEALEGFECCMFIKN